MHFSLFSLLENLQISEIMPIFTVSKGEFAERMTTFMALWVVSSPKYNEPSLFSGGFVVYVQLLLLGNCDAVLYQVLIGALQSHSQFDFQLRHPQMTSQLYGQIARAKVQKLCETRKYLWNYLLLSEFCRVSTKKNALFFVFAAPKFANIEINSYLCSVKGTYLG